MKVLRSMTPDEDGLPGVEGNPARVLDVRTSGPRADVAVDQDGNVHFDLGGMSASPPPPENLPKHRRPPKYGGTGQDPVFGLETSDLPPELVYLPDPYKPTIHGFIVPAGTMSLEDYQQELRATRELWTRM